MVGVPGKYKGCETCRRRRVKCTNERPYCTKCANSGRQCDGYERDRVFITGTVATKGRVASHPKKGVTTAAETRREGKQRKRNASRSLTLSPPSVTSAGHPTSALEEDNATTGRGGACPSLVTALHTNLQSDESTPSLSSSYDYQDDQPFPLEPLPPCSIPHLPSTADVSTGMDCEAKLLVNSPTPHSGINNLMNSYSLFLYEHDSFAKPEWRAAEKSQSNAVRDQGPAYYQAFPNHHFFARVYRPMALCTALLNRTETFLSLDEWRITPWERHAKSLLDQLIDISLFVPSLLARSDHLFTEPATMDRQERAKDLLRSCLAIDNKFDQWHMLAAQGTSEYHMSYWPETDPGQALTMFPFPYALTFKDSMTGMTFLYYWMVQVIFYQCITTVYHITLETPVDSLFPDVWHSAPPTLAADVSIDLTKYHQTRELAANICRGLDGVLGSTKQPDLLVAPLRVAADFYQQLDAISQDAMMEIMWLDSFRDRLRAKGQQVAESLQAQQWSKATEHEETHVG